jgi:hypothetical protein
MNIAKATKEYIEEHPYEKDCLMKGLINYSALARKISEEIKSEKKASFDAIMVALRRLSEKNAPASDNEKQIRLLLKEGKFEIKNKVSALIFDERATIDNIIYSSERALEKGTNFHIIQGTKSTTIITDDEYASEISEKLRPYLLKERQSLIQITHKCSEKVEETNGFLNHITGIFSENGVNIYEALSSWTDTIFLIDQNDGSKIFSILNFRK